MLDLDFSALRGSDDKPDITPSGADGVTRAELRRRRASVERTRVGILTVCTGNICRSPLAQQLLHARLPELLVTSAGTHARAEDRMPADAVRLATNLGVPVADAEAHRARRLSEALLTEPALVLAMTREHRSAVVDLAPAQLRRTFTIREFARLSAPLDDARVAEIAAEAGTDASARISRVVAAVAAQRGVVLPPDDIEADDVIDPYQREWEVFELTADELLPAIDEVTRVLRIPLATT